MVNSEQEPEKSLTRRSESQGFKYSDFNNPSFLKAVVFALAIVTLSLIFYVFNLHSQINARNSEIEEREARLSELSETAEKQKQMLAVLQSGDITVVFFSGMEANPKGSGKLILGAEKALLQVSNLQPSPEEAQYRLWAIASDSTTSLGTFSVSGDQQNFYLFEDLDTSATSQIDAYAVSLESGNTGSPTGEWYLWGNLPSN